LKGALGREGIDRNRRAQIHHDGHAAGMAEAVGGYGIHQAVDTHHVGPGQRHR